MEHFIPAEMYRLDFNHVYLFFFKYVIQYFLLQYFLLQWSANGEYLFCQKDDALCVLSLDKGSTISLFGESNDDSENDRINCFILIDDDTIISHHKSGLFKLWNWKSNYLNF